MIRNRRLPGRLVAVLLTASLAVAFTPPAAADGGAGQPLKKVGEGMKKLGRKIGDAGKEAGEEIAETSRKIWFRGRQVSARLLRRTQHATRDWWEEVLEGKDRTIRELRRENARLKRQLAREGE